MVKLTVFVFARWSKPQCHSVPPILKITLKQNFSWFLYHELDVFFFTSTKKNILFASQKQQLGTWSHPVTASETFVHLRQSYTKTTNFEKEVPNIKKLKYHVPLTTAKVRLFQTYFPERNFKVNKKVWERQKSSIIKVFPLKTYQNILFLCHSSPTLNKNSPTASISLVKKQFYLGTNFHDEGFNLRREKILKSCLKYALQENPMEKH